MIAATVNDKVVNDHLLATIRLLSTALLCPSLNEWEVEKLLALIVAISRRIKDYSSRETEAPRGGNGSMDRTMRN